MHKALTQMNVQIHHVISDITGVTGTLDCGCHSWAGSGIRWSWQSYAIRTSEPVKKSIRKSLVGNWRPEHLFTLRQSRDLYRHYQEQIAACDAEISQLLVRDRETRPFGPDRKAMLLAEAPPAGIPPPMHALPEATFDHTNGDLQVVRCERDADSGAAAEWSCGSSAKWGAT